MNMEEANNKREKCYPVAYLDCFSGISGDMFLGALLDAGMDLDVLERALSLLPVKGFTIHISREKRGGISGTRFIVDVNEEIQPHRVLSEIKEFINSSRLPSEVKADSIAIFELLARAEAKVHGLSPEEIHFHEVGAVDSIVDIVGVCVSIHHMEIKEMYASPLPLGKGIFKSGHGTLPIPAPATLELLKGVPVFGVDLPYELVTPTGAALLKHFVKTFGPIPSMVVELSGWGVGKRDLTDRPNLLRILLGSQSLEKTVSQDVVVVLETNLDDVAPEILGHLMERLLENGALDVAFFPIHMKKNRPGIQIQVIAPSDLAEPLIKVIFLETHTLGVRISYVGRKVLKREKITVESPWGTMEVKRATLPHGGYALKPEYESCKCLANKTQTPLREIVDWVCRLNRPTKPKATDEENG